jgi:hypothetical protein
MSVAQRVQEISTDLVVVEKLTPAAVFAPGGVQDILDRIAREVRSTHTDISTKAGRDAVASLAYKVARSKTALDKMGKDLGQTHYDSWKAITAERSRIEKELDALRDEARKPLTDWENAEKDRISGHESALIAIEDLARFDFAPSLADIEFRLDAFLSLPPREWQEFAQRAAGITAATTDALTRMHQEAVKRDADAAELVRLRAEQVAREQKERDDRIAAEAADRARAEAEAKAAREAAEAAAKAEVERKRVEQEKADAVARAEKAEADRNAAAAKAEQDAKDAAEAAERERQEIQRKAAAEATAADERVKAAEDARVKQAEQAERDKKAAAEAAERDRLAAIEDERKRVADEAARAAAETAKREANTKHLAKINNEVLAALAARSVDPDLGKTIIAAIARGEIPHTKISY